MSETRQVMINYSLAKDFYSFGKQRRFSYQRPSVQTDYNTNPRSMFGGDGRSTSFGVGERFRKTAVDSKLGFNVSLCRSFAATWDLYNQNLI